MPPLFVDGVEIESVYVDGIEQDNLFVDGVEVFSAFKFDGTWETKTVLSTGPISVGTFYLVGTGNIRARTILAGVNVNVDGAQLVANADGTFVPGDSVATQIGNNGFGYGYVLRQVANGVQVAITNGEQNLNLAAFSPVLVFTPKVGWAAQKVTSGANLGGNTVSLIGSGFTLRIQVSNNTQSDTIRID